MVVDEFGRWKYVVNMFVEKWKFWLNYGSGGKFVHFANDMKNHK